MNLFSSPFGDFDLRRYPATTDPNLQAWDSADRYVLAHIHETIPNDVTGQTVICNDEFGGITTALRGRQPLAWNDSALAHHAIGSNFERNQLTQEWTPVRSIDALPIGDRPVSLVVVKIPKSLALLEDQLARLAPVVTAETVIVGAAKVKHIHTSTLKLFEKYLGPTKTSLAKQKARRIFCSSETDGTTPSPWPQSFDYSGRPVLGLAGVFSHRKLDQGTRFLLDQMKQRSWFEGVSTVVDVGCGNGLLGLQAISQNEDISCVFADRSYSAVESSRQNVGQWFPGASQHRFVVSDSLSPIGGVSEAGCDQLILDTSSVDLVLCNPPFHDNYVMGEETAYEMFSQSARLLGGKGRLVVVANRHLRYLPILNRLFSDVEVSASNRKFVVLVAERPNR